MNIDTEERLPDVDKNGLKPWEIWGKKLSSLEMDSTLHYCIKQEKQSVYLKLNSNKWTM